VLDLLVRDTAKEVRQALAKAVASSPSLPPPTALRPARNDIAVARPILEHSPILDDEALINVVRANAIRYALAVVGREGLLSNDIRNWIAGGMRIRTPAVMPVPPRAGRPGRA
jgi:uncharacterized protein (DUF2336 family)